MQSVAAYAELWCLSAAKHIVAEAVVLSRQQVFARVCLKIDLQEFVPLKFMPFRNGPFDLA